MNQVLEIALLMGVAPMLTYAAVLWWLDRWEPEPIPLVLAALAWGAMPAVWLTHLLHPPLLNGLGQVLRPETARLLTGPALEELIKGGGVLLVYWHFHHELDSWLDGVVYGSAVGFGFAASENVVYFLRFGASHPDSFFLVIYWRAFAFGLNHALFTSFIGLGLIQARYSPRWLGRILWMIAGLLVAITLHGVHNVLVADGTHLHSALLIDWLGVVALVLIGGSSLIQERRWLQTYLQEEVEQGTLTAEQATAACRFSTRLLSLPLIRDHKTSTQRDHQSLCVELALKKHQACLIPKDPRTTTRIQKLRSRLNSLKREEPE